MINYDNLTRLLTEEHFHLHIEDLFEYLVQELHNGGIYYSEPRSRLLYVYGFRDSFLDQEIDESGKEYSSYQYGYSDGLEAFYDHLR